MDVDGVRAQVKESQWRGAGPHLLSVGRLSSEKGYDLLLQAMTILKQEYPEAELAIAGKGAEEGSLKRLCSGLGLNGAVRFLGEVAEPAVYYAGASVFVQPSRHEGLPNALLEAGAGGVPIVSTPSSGGIVQLLRGQEGAWLTDGISARALAASLSTALRELEPGQRFPHPWVEEFRLERAVHAYEQMIDTVLAATAV